MSLVVWLPLNGDLRNQGLSNITFTDTNATINNNGKIGKCYSFNGSSNFLRFLYPASNLQGQWSYCCWVKCANFNTNYTLLSSRKAVGAGLSVFLISGKVRFDNGTDGTTSQTSFSTSLTPGVWQHLCVIQTASKRELYIDGKLKESILANPITSASNTAQYMLIGGSSTSDTTPTGNWLNGSLNDVRIYSHALSKKEVEEISKGLILHYSLDGENKILVPSGYQQLEYLESTTSQYIDTGKIPQTTYEYRFKYSLQAINGDRGPFAAYSTDSANTVRIVPSNGSATTVLICFNSRANGGSLAVNGLTQGAAQIIEGSLSKNSYFLKNLSTNRTFSAFNPTDLFPVKGSTMNSRMCLFGSPGRISNSRIFYFETYNNGSCIQKLVPAQRLSDNTLGMYDVISGTFFTNAGNGFFTAGPSVLIGNTVHDCSGYFNDGTVSGDLSAITGSPRYNIYTSNFGSNSIVRPSPSAEVKTISFWLKTPNKSNQIAFVDNLSGMSFGFYNNGNFILVIYGTYSNITYPSNDYIVNAWNHICLVKNSTVDLYINGVKQTISSYTNYWSNTNANLSIGNRQNNNMPLNATSGISDFRMYVTAFTPVQVKELYDTSVSIDSLGNVQARQLGDLTFNEDFQIFKNGIVQAADFIEQNQQSVSIDKNKEILGGQFYEY